MISKNFLYISKNTFVTKEIGGRELLSKTNFKNFRKIYNKNFYYYKLKNSKIKKLSNFLKSFFGHIDGINEKSLSKIEKLVKIKKIDVVFIDGSNLGECANFIKKKFPNIKLIIYFHNIESKFFYDSMILKKTIKSFFILLVNYFAEKKSIKYADKLIVLTKNDSRIMKYIYKKSADFIIPLSIIPKKIKKFSLQHPKNNFLIFVGGNFYANLEGIRWFIKNVLPFINCNLIIIGKGFAKSDFFLTNKIYFVENVKNLEKWYNKSFASISPIFSGSGMKTKVAESLMYGKRIFGTNKAFAGYENLKKYRNIAIECNNSRRFIFSINKALNLNKNLFNNKARFLFKKFYSSDSNYKIFLNFLAKNNFI
jgi:polysaccharide biosynthesis protein PslH